MTIFLEDKGQKRKESYFFIFIWTVSAKLAETFGQKGFENLNPFVGLAEDMYAETHTK